jgi:lipoprotein-releasing system permease protein
LNNWESDQIGGYEIFLHNLDNMDAVSAEIVPYLPTGLQSNTIVNIFPNIFDWLNLQNKTIWIVLAIMIVTATLNLITCLLILVLERIRMIGILKSLGAGNSTVQGVFLIHGTIITVIGLLLGNFLGLAVAWLQQQYGFISLPEDAYYISQAAVNVVWWQIAAVNIGTFLVCFVVLLIPTIIVKKVQPVKAIQFR